MEPLTSAKSIAQEITDWRRELHKIPELGLYLPQTANFVMAKLDQWGVPYQTYQDHSAVVALLGKPGGKVLALRADMDALPLKEASLCEYSSQNENMHACGHDAHTAILLGVAKLLKSNESLLNGQVKLFFQPGEEGPGGAAPMIKDGCLKNPDVDAIYALHVSQPNEGEQNGQIQVKYGDITAADDQFDLTVIGKGGHGAAPHLCIDPVVVATQIISTLQTVISREVDPNTPAVITVATLQAGRGAENIISDTCYMRGTIRNANMQMREYVLARVEEVIKGVCLAMRADYDFKLDFGYLPVTNDKIMTDNLIASAAKIVGTDGIKLYDKQAMGGEDAGFFYQQVPGCFFQLNCSAPYDDGVTYPAHNSKFKLDDSQLYLGSAIFVQAALDYLNQ